MSTDNNAWKQTRKKGKWHFILWKGVVFWGLPMFAIQTFIINGPPQPSSWFYSETSKYPALWIAFMLVLGCFFGLLFGLFTWHHNERGFKNAEIVISDDQSIDPPTGEDKFKD